MIGLVEVVADVNGKIVHKPAIELEEAIANVERRLADNHMVALVGMGGIGKTTLMKKLYCQMHADFKKSSFLENIKANDIVEVQKKLIMDLYGLKLQDPTTYLTCTKKCWTKMKVLIIIDDISEIQIIELLGKDMDGIRRSENGSRIIMVGQNWRDFESVVCEDGKFEMELLNKKQAMEFFSLKAFRGSVSPHDVASIANEVVDACNGLPLSLDVMGVWFSTKKNSTRMERGFIDVKKCPTFWGGLSCR